VSRRAIYLLRRPALSPEGVSVTPRLSGPPALLTIGEPREEEKRAEIERLDVGRHATGGGALTGFLVGAAVGGVILAAKGPDLTDANDNIVVYFSVALAVGCGVAGYLLGLANPRLTLLYP